MSFFRKPYLAVIMTPLVVFFSCEQYEESYIIDADTLRNAHQTISSTLNLEMLNFKNSSSIISGRISSNSEDEQELISNLNYVNENGLESLLNKNGIDIEVLAEFEFFAANKGNENVYELLAKKFHFESQEEINFLFNLVEIHSLIESEFSNSSYRIEGWGWGCALAIAGTVAVTVGAIWITGGAALIVFLISKGIATASVINSCT